MKRRLKAALITFGAIIITLGIAFLGSPISTQAATVTSPRVYFTLNGQQYYGYASMSDLGSQKLIAVSHIVAPSSKPAGYLQATAYIVQTSNNVLLAYNNGYSTSTSSSLSVSALGSGVQGREYQT